MKKEQIEELFTQFENACYIYSSVEYWSARELQNIFHYTEWRNFLKVIDKAKAACSNASEPVTNQFVVINKMVSLGSGSEREIRNSE